jgi:hypothetical protein
MSVVSTTLRTLCSAMGVMLGSLYVGGHVQNDTFVDSYLGTVRAQIDPRAGQACVGGACDPQCLWWDHRTGNDTDTQCDSWALRRGVTGDRLTRAMARAEHCAHQAVENCVLSHEVDLPAPAVFFYNASEHRMRLFLLPATTPNPASDLRRVAFFHAGTKSSSWSEIETSFDFRERARVSHYDPWTHVQLQEDVSGEAAYCLQLLVLSVPEECAEGLALPLTNSPDGRV